MCYIQLLLWYSEVLGRKRCCEQLGIIVECRVLQPTRAVMHLRGMRAIERLEDQMSHSNHYKASRKQRCPDDTANVSLSSIRMFRQ